MSNEVSRELIEEKFANTNRRIEEIKKMVEKLSVGMVTDERFQSASIKISRLEEMMREHDKRIDNVEGFTSIWRYIGGAVVMVVIALVIAWLSGVLGV